MMFIGIFVENCYRCEQWKFENSNYSDQKKIKLELK